MGATELIAMVTQNRSRGMYQALIQIEEAIIDAAALTPQES